jgi:hypothetical protein
VVALVEQGIDSASVYLQLAVFQYVAWDCDWKGRGYFLAVSRQEQLAHYVVSEVHAQNAIKQIGLEVNEDIVPVLNQISVIVKVQYHL